MNIVETHWGPVTALEKKTSIAIAICTYRRPVMLRECLLSIAAQEIPHGIEISVIVVDNDADPNAEMAVDDFAEGFQGDECIYIHQPTRGISYARNSAVAVANDIGADWIVFLDDDEVAESGWLEALWQASRTFDCEIIHGHVDFRYETEPTWFSAKRKPKYWEYNAKTAFTNNIMIRMDVFQDNLLAFDPSYALTGGEDHHLVQRARKLGYTIVHTPMAVVTERVPESKMTLRKTVGRNFWIEAANYRIDSEIHGYGKTAVKKGAKAVGKIFGGIWHGLRIPFSALHSKGKRRIARSACKFAGAAGIIVGMMGYKPQPYLTVDGG